MFQNVFYILQRTERETGLGQTAHPVVHPKMKFCHHLLSFKLFQTSEFLSSIEHKRRYFEENKVAGLIDFHIIRKNAMKDNGDHSLKCILFSAEEREFSFFSVNYPFNKRLNRNAECEIDFTG